jgi:hypothetical protein
LICTENGDKEKKPDKVMVVEPNTQLELTVKDSRKKEGARENEV